MLTTENSALVLVDAQGKLAQAMHDKEKFFDSIIRLVKDFLDGMLGGCAISTCHQQLRSIWVFESVSVSGSLEFLIS